jgi:hypothetical protein
MNFKPGDPKIVVVIMVGLVLMNGWLTLFL